jgi:hypothetical protein
MNSPTRLPLYSIQGIVIGALLGTFAASVVLVALNYAALGAPALARRIAWFGVAGYLVLIGIVALVPIEWRLFVASPLQMITAWWLAERLQGQAIRYHLAHGGELRSNFLAAGIALLVGVAMLFLLVTVVAIIGPPPPPQ